MKRVSMPCHTGDTYCAFDLILYFDVVIKALNKRLCPVTDLREVLKRTGVERSYWYSSATLNSRLELAALTAKAMPPP